jgi:hypothetical protein
MNETTPRDRNAALILSLAFGLVQAAYMQMGKMRNEITGKVERNLDAARMTIDTLAALEERTRNNRSEEESSFFQRSLTELRMNYVDELKKDKLAPPPDEPATAGGAPAPAPAADDAPPAGEPAG